MGGQGPFHLYRLLSTLFSVGLSEKPISLSEMQYFDILPYFSYLESVLLYG
jgi:hypothetical protein